MGSYKEMKEAYQDFKKDKVIMGILKVLLALLLIFVCIVVYKSIFEPVKLFGIELNTNKIQHDTVRIIIHDTVLIQEPTSSTTPKDLSNPSKEVKADVKSVNQKGGQTANQIINNK